MTLAPKIIVRYRDAGHVRFEIPAALCTSPGKERLITGLRRIDGIYRVDLYPRLRKLSIRHIETICDFPALCRTLHDLVGAAEMAAPLAPCCSEVETLPTGWRARWSELRPVHWMRGKVHEARQTVSAMGIVARQSVARPGARAIIKESTVIEFLNDALVLYLIKLHWHLITQHWLRQPWRYRYEWLAVFYLIYLLVRSRRPKK